MQDTLWDHRLNVTGEGEGLAGYAGAVLLRSWLPRLGCSGAPGSALARAGSPR